MTEDEKIKVAETAAVARVPLAQLIAPENRFTSVFRRGAAAYRGPAFDVDGTVVWGFTAGVISGLLRTLEWDEPWDATQRVPLADV